jgi:hypothetical protein
MTDRRGEIACYLLSVRGLFQERAGARSRRGSLPPEGLGPIGDATSRFARAFHAATRPRADGEGTRGGHQRSF